jgi:hypothetical protein
MDFRMETENTTKEFYKVSKKQNLWSIGKGKIRCKPICISYA